MITTQELLQYIEQLTENLDEHPEGYEGPCICDECKLNSQ